ncbi:MAG: DUF4340 domain-containing protein [Acidobacteria bacterium]|nr:DUF4340 domain-containing protein [Acidobacteriota bacterium]
MKWKNLAIVAALFAALFAWVYFYEIKGEKTREEAVEKEKKIFQFEEKDIAQITLKSAEGEFVLQKDKDNWKLVQPLAAKADKSTVDSLTSDIAQAKSERALDDPNPNFRNFGLEPAGVKVTVKLNDGKTHELELGDKDFSSSSVFARVPGQNKVLLLSSSLHSSATKKLFDFRDKNVLEFQRDQLKAMNILTKGKEYALEKASDDWNVKKPFESRADNTEINSIVGDLEFAKVEEFVDSTAELKTYGLTSPAVRVDLFLGDNRARKTLLVGNKIDSNYYAKDEARDTVFKIKEDLFKKLDFEATKIRDKKVVRFERPNVKQIDIKLPDKEFSFFRGSDDKWKMSKPEGHKGKVISEYKIFWPLEDLEGKELIDNANLTDPKYGFNSPAAQIKIVDKNNKTTEVALGKLDKEQVFVKTSAGTTLYKVEKKILEDLNLKPEDIIEK